MASTTTVLDPTADDHHSLQLDSLPLIDLNLLSQSELYSLSLCSSSSSSHAHRRCDDDVLIPKIDRSVFNESAGSRKQTYSRLRLAPRNSQFASSSSARSAASSSPSFTRQTTTIAALEPLDQENVQIIGLLKQLFASKTHDDLVPVRVEYNDDSSVLHQPFNNNVVHSIPIDVVVFDNTSQKKRKRGRPRKDANLAVENFYSNGSSTREVPVELASSNAVFYDSPKEIVDGGGPAKRKRGRPRKDEKRAVEGSITAGRVEVVKEEGLVDVNRNGGAVDLVSLGNMEDPFGKELRKRTEVLETEAELLGFLGGLEGEWVTKKKKIVQASQFGDALPRDWKIMLSVERREGRVYLFCRRYISPNGQQFLSCKEVSSYLLAYVGFQDASQSKPGHGDSDSQIVSKTGSEYDANFQFQNDKDAIELISCSPVLITSVSTDEEKQATLSKTRNPEEVQNFDLLKCHICMMTFNEKNGLLHHLSSHEGTANRCNRHFSVYEGVIVKDEKYECQFCHKIFDEWIQYNGHIGVHVKSNEVLEGLSNKQKSSDPVLNVDSLTSLKMQESIGTEKEKTLNSEASFKLSSGFADSELKEDADTRACTDGENHGLVSYSHNEVALNSSKDEKDKKYCEIQDKVCNMTNHNLGKLDEAVEVSVCGSSNWVAALASNNENENNCEFSNKANAVNCISNEISGGLLASVDKEDKCSKKDIEHGQITSRVEDNVDEFENYNSISGDSGPEDVYSNVKRQSIYQGFSSIPSGNEQSCGSVKDGNGNPNSILLKSVQVRGSEIDICSSSSDKQTCVVGNNVNNVGAIGNGGNHVGANVNAASIGETDRILGGCYCIPTLNKPGCVAEDFAKNPNCMRERPLEEQSFESDESTPVIVDKSVVVDNVIKSSIGTINGTKVADAKNSKNSKCIAFGTKDTEIDANIIPDMEQEGTFKGCSLVLSSNANEHASVLKDNVICNSKTEELKWNIVSPESHLPSCSGCGQSYDLVNNMNNRSSHLIQEHINNEVKSSCNNEELHDFGSCNTGIDVNTVTGNVAGRRSSEGFSPVISGNIQTISIATTVPGVCIGTLEELNLKRGSEIDFIGPSGSEQIDATEKKITMVHSRTLSNQPTPEDLEKSRNDDQMTVLGNISQPSGEIMSELICRTDEQNVQRSRSAGTSSALMQVSGSFPNFDILSDKGANGDFSNNESFESTSGLEGPRLGSIRPSKYNFLTLQGSSQSNESKVLSDDAEMGKSCDSYFWLEKEARPQTASRIQTVTVCAWCGEECHHEAVNPEKHSGSVGLVCATCQFKFSSQFNPL
ncbi:uncharacterized protein LOC107407675 isoform X1 [Ziziphus jujuba]|uniref:Uncharacterized protein LOC107407675 isoform X1 n=1 Tax=Ziziphus jujuba TaxID=326968 RepID=A0A6P6FT94_ZIZJJ|nr:uncharacterized protein LOC107407675 isoform X1 [Ziziphus jujuba]XP_015870470.3 uncharacterized protein LOC107407675 isoform X1 [Ziziphus jujuba]